MRLRIGGIAAQGFLEAAPGLIRISCGERRLSFAEPIPSRSVFRALSQRRKCSSRCGHSLVASILDIDVLHTARGKHFEQTRRISLKAQPVPNDFLSPAPKRFPFFGPIQQPLDLSSQIVSPVGPDHGISEQPFREGNPVRNQNRFAPQSFPQTGSGHIIGRVPDRMGGENDFGGRIKRRNLLGRNRSHDAIRDIRMPFPVGTVYLEP